MRTRETNQTLFFAKLVLFGVLSLALGVLAGRKLEHSQPCCPARPATKVSIKLSGAEVLRIYSLHKSEIDTIWTDPVWNECEDVTMQMAVEEWLRRQFAPCPCEGCP